MGISLLTHKKLWGRSGNRCAFPGCRKELIQDVDTSASSVLAQECHIVAREDRGPRADPAKPLEERDAYENLILLCLEHHKVVDDHETIYTVEKLHDMKADHEAWVLSQTDFSRARQQDDELYAAILDRWADGCELERWDVWTSWMLSANGPHVTVELDRKFRKLREWLLSLKLPARYRHVNRALRNFRLVLDDLQNAFWEHGEEKNEEIFTDKFYKSRDWDSMRYDALLAEYNYHVSLVQDLVCELTRAANFVIRRAQLAFAPYYRRLEGMPLVTVGPFSDFSTRTLNLRYAPRRRSESHTRIQGSRNSSALAFRAITRARRLRTCGDAGAVSTGRSTAPPWGCAPPVGAQRAQAASAPARAARLWPTA